MEETIHVHTPQPFNTVSSVCQRKQLHRLDLIVLLSYSTFIILSFTIMSHFCSVLNIPSFIYGFTLLF